MNSSQTTNTDEFGPDMVDAEDALTAKQDRVIQALLTHPTKKEAALAAGVSEATLWRYEKDEAFSRRLEEARRAARRESLNQNSVRLQRATADAIDFLHILVGNGDAPFTARVTAARTILDQDHRARLGELESRLNELDEFLKAKGEEDAIYAAARERR